jgi:precorrin isomerase
VHFSVWQKGVSTTTTKTINAEIFKCLERENQREMYEEIKPTKSSEQRSRTLTRTNKKIVFVLNNSSSFNKRD